MRIFPMPEAVAAEDWTIIPEERGVQQATGARVDRYCPVERQRRVISHVAGAETSAASANRMIRLAAVRHAPETYTGLSKFSEEFRVTVGCLEEARLLFLADRAGLEWKYVDKSELEFYDKGRSAFNNGVLSTALSQAIFTNGYYAMAMFLTSLGNTLNCPLEEACEYLTEQLNGITNDPIHTSYINSTRANIKSGLKVAKRILGEIAKDPSYENSLRIAKQVLEETEGQARAFHCPISIGRCVDETGKTHKMRVEGDETITEADITESATAFANMFDIEVSGVMGYVPDQNKLTWGRLLGVKRLAMNSLMGTSVIKRLKVRSHEQGAVMRSPHRVMIDQRVFRSRERIPGGTVLLDFSGSMKISPQQVVALLSRSRHLTVAAYSGASDSGYVTILAEKNHCAPGVELNNFKNHSPGCNVIDGPALRWLATQAKPRIWVSDGQVTGIGDAGNIANNRDVVQILKQGRIKWLKTLKAAADFLADRVE